MLSAIWIARRNWVAFGVICVIGCSPNMNRLSSEKSPYLQSHKDNPVWWQAWGEGAFTLAKTQDKPIFLSIGYSTCHWCHVMEHESFENAEVASFLNDHFISIKVDREERPDVDALYMNAVLAISGHGGWPMSVWLTPEGKPFFGGTYFPKEPFLKLLERIHDAWITQRDRLLTDAGRLTAVTIAEEDTAGGTLSDEVFERFVESHRQRFDSKQGGFGGAPKFPAAMSLMALMRIERRSKPEKAKEISGWVRQTLNSMGRGGIYDHLRGGFHRYSTDEQWLVPHFEKMLYDNALLAMAYLEASLFYGEEEYARITREILDYVLREMTDPEGGFYSAEDADSEVSGKGHSGENKKEEGFFCTYSFNELKQALNEQELSELKIFYGVSEAGNFEGRNILHLMPGKTRVDRARPLLQSAFVKLEKIRSSKQRPHVDRKILTAWNGLMIAVLSRASRALGEPKYLAAATKAMDFILKELQKNGQLLRRSVDGEARVNAYSEDYAGLIHALIWLYQSDFNPRWLSLARDLQKTQNELFWDDRVGGYYTDDGTDRLLLTRAKDGHDGVVPTAHSLSALNLLRLKNLTYESEYGERAEKIFKASSRVLAETPLALSQMVIAYDFKQDHSKEVAVVGPAKETLVFLEVFWKGFFPNLVLASGESESVPLLKGKTPIGGKATVYVCENRSCKLPTQDLGKATELARGLKALQ